MKIAIAGAGAMGSRFGAKLLAAGNDVLLIDNWADHVKAIQQHGLQITTDDGTTTTVGIAASLPTDVSTEFDLVILFTKAMQMSAMLADIQGIMTPTTTVLTLANGIGNVETIEQHVPRANIVAGTTVWSSTLLGPGHIGVTGSGSIALQAIEPDAFPDLSSLIATLNTAGLNASAADDVLAAIWKKAGLNSVLNTYCTLLDCDIAAFGQLPDWAKLAMEVLNEFKAVAQAKKIDFHRNAVASLIADQFAPDKNGHHFPSMHQDLANGRPTEIDFLNGYIAREGERLGIPVPINTELTDLIHAQETLKGVHD